MLQYFSSKKEKKNREEKPDKVRVEKEEKERAKSPKSTPAATPSTVISKPSESKPDEEPVGTPLLDQEDEQFLERLTSPDSSTLDDEGTPPPLPPRIPTPVITWDSDAESFRSQESIAGNNAKGKGKGKETLTKPDIKDADKKPNNKRFSVLTNIGRSISLRKKPNKNEVKPEHLTAVPEKEVRKEETDISQVLEDLNLSAQNNKVFSLSAESTEMVRRFTLVLKDLVNGVPTAYGDLVGLLEDRDGILAKNYEKLPKSLKKLVTQLPNKLTSTLAPELLAVAAEAQGLNAAAASSAGIKGAAKSFLTPKNLQDLVTKPGAVVGMLKAIVNALKLRWPAFIGTNVLWSVALFLLLSVLWYCHKRGRETRLEREAGVQDPIDGGTRIEELPDDPQLPAPGQGSTSGNNLNLPRQPAGERRKASPVRTESRKN